MKIVFLFLSMFWLPNLFAGSWEDTFLGLERSAHQDSLGHDGGRDLFSASVNPAWIPEASQLSSVLAYHKGYLKTRVQESPEVLLWASGIFLRKGSFGAGMLMSLPFLDSAALDTGRTQGFSAPWTARDRLLQFQPFIAKDYFDGRFTLGLMFPISFDIKSESQISMNSAAPSSRVKAGTDPNVTWGLGSIWRFNGGSASLAYRERKRSETYVTVKGEIPVGSGPNIDLLAEGSAPYSYEPRRITTQLSFRSSAAFSWGLWLRYNQWQEMPAPILIMRYYSPALETPTPNFKARNTWEGSIGGAYDVSEHWALLSSYRYSQTPFKKTLFFYDANTHHLGAGASWSLEDTWKFSTIGRVSLLESGGFYGYFALGGTVLL